MSKPKEKKYVINRQQILRILRERDWRYRDEEYRELCQKRDSRERELKDSDREYQTICDRLGLVTKRCDKAQAKRETERKKLLAEFITTTKCSPAFLTKLRKYIGERS